MSDPVKAGHLFPSAGAPIGYKKAASLPSAEGTASFRNLLHANELKFSQHAETRMKQRGISLNIEQLTQIAGAVEQAEAKGAKDSLILYKDIAMIVNVPSKTVVTAMEGGAFQGNIFTQIDSAVVIS